MRHCHALILALLTAGFGLAGIVRADDSPASVGPHGGVVVAANTTRFEVVSAADGITVYPVTTANQPLDTTRWTGTATFYAPATSAPWLVRPLQPAAVSASRPPTALALRMNLSQALPAQGVTVAVEIHGLPAPAASSAQFTVPYAPATALPITVATATAADAAAIAAQKTCPISGDDLHEMGMPVKVSRGNRAVFVCCDGCVAKIKANPDKYLAAAAPAPTAEYVCAMHSNVVRSTPGNCPICGMKLSKRTAAHHH